MEHTRLSKERRKKIAASLQQGVSKEKIINDIREEAVSQSDQPFKRYHLIGKKDLSNIKSAFAISDIQRHSNDQCSVKAWVEEWSANESNPILFTKFQGDEPPSGFNLTKDDFLIVVQTPFQKLMAQKFAHKGICVDSTHGTTGYDFLLTTVVALDEFGEGIPIGWLLSNHEDFTHMCIFFEMLKKNCGVLYPHWVMSDMANQFYNAWIGVMGGHPIRLLCTWHVDRAWQTELRAKVKDTVVAGEIYKMLRVVLQQTDVTAFREYISHFAERIPVLNLQFSKYFQQEWASKPELWAYCYRKGLGINTNMAVEAFHRAFKYGYLKGKINKRVDSCLINLLKYIRDKSFDRVVKLTKGKSTHKIKLIKDRHNKSKSLPVTLIKEDSDTRWLVESGTNDEITYTVFKQANECLDMACQLKCSQCNICVHQYICDCPDSLIHNTICKHIHLIKRHLTNNATDQTSGSVVGTQEESTVGYKDTEVTLVASHLQQDKKPPQDLSSLRQTLQDRLQQFVEELNGCDDKDILCQISKKVNASYHLYKSLTKENTSFTIKPVSNSPANKTIRPQQRFKSTKKKRKRNNNVRFAKPSHDDVTSLFTDDPNGKLYYMTLIKIYH